jgi:hypothetical protein
MIYSLETATNPQLMEVWKYAEPRATTLGCATVFIPFVIHALGDCKAEERGREGRKGDKLGDWGEYLGPVLINSNLQLLICIH